MRVVQFIQVIVLLGLIGYVVLLALENPLTVHLPLPFGLDPTLPLGVVLGGALVLGALYASLLYLPRLLLGALRRRREARRRRELETQLQATLQAKLVGAARPAPQLSEQDDVATPWTDQTEPPTPEAMPAGEVRA